MSESLEGLYMTILMDQHDRWRNGDRPLVESYLIQIPALGTDTDRLLDVIYHEILLRESAGEMPIADEYLRRFPNLSEELKLQFEVHSGLPSAQTVFDDELENHPVPEIAGDRIIRELGRGDADTG